MLLSKHIFAQIHCAQFMAIKYKFYTLTHIHMSESSDSAY